MAVHVIRTTRGLVKPAEQKASTTLDLSPIDRLPVLRCNARTLHVFRYGPQASTVIREALSRALVPYYPLAGRLSQPERGPLQIECSGEGVWFVEASASSTLASVNYFDDVESIPYDDLLPDRIPDPETGHVDPLVKMQVTQFRCWGFVIGLIFCHSVCDGLGAAQFLKAIGEVARGLEKPSIAPVWHRDFFPLTSDEETVSASSKLPPGPPPMPEYKLEHANIDIPIDHIHRLKREFQQVTGQNCSAFEIVAAGYWMSRTRAINLGPNTLVKLVFFANCRQLLNLPLPKGFYGNCFFPVTITIPSESLTQASMIEAIKGPFVYQTYHKLIQEGKARLPAEFDKYLKGEHVKDGEDPFAPPLTYTTLFISEWGRLGFNEVDYQWGPPVHVVPIQGSSIVPVGIVGSLPLPRKGIRLMTWCVEEAHRGPFLHQMTSWTH